MAAPVYESGTVSTGSGTSTTVSMPSTRPDGDLYLLTFYIDGGYGIDDIQGVEQWNLSEVTNEGSVTHYTFWRIGDSEPASYSLTHSSEVTAAVVTRVSGANYVRVTEATGSGANGSAPTHTTVEDESLVIRSIAVDRDNVTGTPSTEIAKGGGGGANDVGYGISYETGPNPAGSTGTSAFTHDTDGYAAVTIELINIPDRPVIESTTLSSNSTEATTLTVNMPTTRPDNDLYICIIGADGSGNFTLPSPAADHWTLIDNTVNGTECRQAAWYFDGSSEPVSYSITTASEQSWAVVIRISNGAYEGDTSTTDSTSTPNAPAITTVSNDTIIIKSTTIDEENIVLTPGIEYHTGQTSSSGGVGYGVWEEPGPYPAGTHALTDSEAEGSDECVGMSISIKYSATTGDKTVVIGSAIGFTLSQVTPTVSIAELNTVNVQAFTLAQVSPTIIQGTGVTVVIGAAQDFTLAVQSATVSISETNIAGNLDFPLGIESPTVQAISNITIVRGTALDFPLAQQSPSVKVDESNIPNTIAFTEGVESVTVSGGATITIGAAIDFPLSQVAPSISISDTATIGAAIDFPLGVESATVDTGTNVTVVIGAAIGFTESPQAASVKVDESNIPNTLNFPLGIESVTVSAGTTITIGAALDFPLGIESATVSVSESITQNVIDFPLGIESPTISGQAVVTVNAVAFSIAQQAPSIAIGESNIPNTLAYSLAQVSPSVNTDWTVIRGTALDFALAQLVPTIIVEGGVTVVIGAAINFTEGQEAPTPKTDWTVSIGAAINFTEGQVSPSVAIGEANIPNTIAFALGIESPSIATDWLYQVGGVQDFTLGIESVTVGTGVTVAIGAAIDFPLGQESPSISVAESNTVNAIGFTLGQKTPTISTGITESIAAPIQEDLTILSPTILADGGALITPTPLNFDLGIEAGTYSGDANVVRSGTQWWILTQKKAKVRIDKTVVIGATIDFDLDQVSPTIETPVIGVTIDEGYVLDPKNPFVIYTRSGSINIKMPEPDENVQFILDAGKGIQNIFTDYPAEVSISSPISFAIGQPKPQLFPINIGAPINEILTIHSPTVSGNVLPPVIPPVIPQDYEYPLPTVWHYWNET